MNFSVDDIDWDKSEGLIPAVIQHVHTLQVLMLGYMNIDALQQTLRTRVVTFYSRSKNRLWIKGETSKNYLALQQIFLDCDKDTLLIMALPAGDTCHLQRTSCFDNGTAPGIGLMAELLRIIDDRYEHPQSGSYTTTLFAEGIFRCAQKVGEEGVEVALASVKNDLHELANESADLIFHLLVLLRKSNLPFADVLTVLRQRMEKHVKNS